MPEPAGFATPGFLFVTCQVGAEPALKRELARDWPDLRFAYSRPGFLTFKLPPAHPLATQLNLRSVFARTAGYSLGKLTGASADELARSLWPLVGERPIHGVHVWQRDAYPPGDHGFQPGPTPLSIAAAAAIEQQLPPTAAPASSILVNQIAERGQTVLDCVIVEPTEWWIGLHRVDASPSRWPGGVLPIEPPANMVSRAYLKMEESLAWSGLPIAASDACVELGSAPGGASQALLGHGLIVNGIDPAEMDPCVLADPNFHYLRMRAGDLKRREFRGVKWLMSDMNVLPWITLDAVESIVTNRQVSVAGLLLTLKLAEWSLAEEIPNYLNRIRNWGYREVRARQLAFNRQEICVTALKSRSNRRR